MVTESQHDHLCEQSNSSILLKKVQIFSKIVWYDRKQINETMFIYRVESIILLGILIGSAFKICLASHIVLQSLVLYGF